MPTLLPKRKATRSRAPARAPGRSGVVRDPGMHARSWHGNREISRPTTGPRAVWSASGRRGAGADDARTGEVRPRHRSGEAGEQRRATVRGGGGAKGEGRGERGSGPHAPGSGPGKRVKGAGPRTASCKTASPSDTQGGSRVPESGSLGSVRGALSNGRPCRDRPQNRLVGTSVISLTLTYLMQIYAALRERHALGLK